MKNDDDLLQDLEKKAAKKIGGKLLKILAPILGTFLMIFLGAFVIFGAVYAVGEFFSNAWENISGAFEFGDDGVDLSTLTYEEWIDNPLYVQQALEEGLIEFDDMQLGLLDGNTIELIFEKIVEYEESREMEKEVTYSIRTERLTGTSEGSTSSFPEMDIYGNTDADNALNDAFDFSVDVSFDKERTVTLRRIDIESGYTANGEDLLRMRWQPILALCSILATQNNADWGASSDVNLATASREELEDLGYYYITEEEIEDIIDLFFFKGTYFFDPLSDTREYYDFNYFTGGNTCAYRYSTIITGSSDGTQERITIREPAIAPNFVNNSYAKYEYQYNSDGQCVSRIYSLDSSHYFESCNEILPDGYDHGYFLELLELLPETSDLQEFYGSANFKNQTYDFTEEDDPDKVKTIGIYLVNSDYSMESDELGGSFTSFGETLPLYAYSRSSGQLGELHLYVNENYQDANGDYYQEYTFVPYATRPINQYEGLTVEQVEDLLTNHNYFADCRSCALFSDAAAIRRTAETFVNVCSGAQVSSDGSHANLSILFVLGLMRQEGAIRNNNICGRNYNYINYTGLSPYNTISGYLTNYKDYLRAKGVSDEDAPWVALEKQLYFIYEKYVVDRRQLTTRDMCWTGYSVENKYAGLSYSYCPPYYDYAMPYRADSYYIKDGVTKSWRGGSYPYNGWSNGVAMYWTGFAEYLGIEYEDNGDAGTEEVTEGAVTE